MRHFFLVCGLFIAAVLLLSAPQVRADGLDNFTFTESDGVDTLMLTWQLPATGTPDQSVLGAEFVYMDVPTAVFLDGSFQTTISDTFAFFAGSGFLDSLGFSLVGGSQTYSGPESNPSFLVGTYNGIDPNNMDENGKPFASTLTIAKTPEPSALLMLCFGFLVLVGAMALKKVQV